VFKRYGGRGGGGGGYNGCGGGGGRGGYNGCGGGGGRGGYNGCGGGGGRGGGELGELVYIKLPDLLFVSSFIFNFPVAGSNPKIYNKTRMITDINMKGIKTIIHDIRLIPIEHNAFNRKVMIIMTINFKPAVLYWP